ncbi:MAG: MBL fold metallo-hydrolase [Desulfobacterales bacterium]
MRTIPYTKGLHQLNDGVYAYLSPDGSWGLSNAGLVVDSGESLLIDTLFDTKLTGGMLSEMAAATSDARSIDTLVITHGNGDHFYGSELLPNAEIIASTTCSEEMKNAPPEGLSRLLEAAPSLGPAGEFAAEMFGRFEFKGLNPRMPTRTFDGRMELGVGKKTAILIEVGPAHTKGDVIIHIPENRVVFAGDMLFIGGTPIMWAGPASNWIRACDLMLDLDANYYVPGHGPVTDKAGVADVKGYIEYIHGEALKRYEAGMTPQETAFDIDPGIYRTWGDRERIVVNVNTLFKEFSGEESPDDVLTLFTQMARLAQRK